MEKNLDVNQIEQQNGKALGLNTGVDFFISSVVGKIQDLFGIGKIKSIDELDIIESDTLKDMILNYLKELPEFESKNIRLGDVRDDGDYLYVEYGIRNEVEEGNADIVEYDVKTIIIEKNDLL